MLELDFNEYQNTLKKQQKTGFPTQYFQEDSKNITLIFKTRELWEHFTVVSKASIIKFSEMFDIPAEDAINHFKINYCSNCIPLSSNKEFSPDLLSKKKDDLIDPGDDVIDESVDYGDFYKNIVNKWEAKILKALDEIPIEKMYTPETLKTFGEFLRRMMNSINSVVFLRAVNKYVKEGLVAGMESAEEELKVQIGFTQEFQDQRKLLSQQQIEGYTINGQKWHGIKGATKELQFKILKQIQDDLGKKIPRQEMRENIKEIFEGSTTSQAERIARTEVNRFISQGKLTAYKESNIPGKKLYSAVNDSRTSEICRRLDKKYGTIGIELDDVFIDDVTMKSGLFPPFAHPNCRCIIRFSPDHN